MKQEKNILLDKKIMELYDIEDNKTLSKKLGISEVSLRKRASRLGIRKTTKANAIINGMKRCSRCHKIKHVSNFYKDCYQPNNISYVCIECKLKEKEEKKEDEEEEEERSGITPKPVTETVNGGLGYGKKKTRNPPIRDRNGKIIGIRCKACYEIKKPEEFTIDRKNHQHGHRNYCKKCDKEKRDRLKREKENQKMAIKR